jgi:hypothetical protein
MEKVPETQVCDYCGTTLDPEKMAQGRYCCLKYYAHEVLKCQPWRDRRRTTKRVTIKTDSLTLAMLQKMAVVQGLGTWEALADKLLQLGLEEFIRRNNDERLKRIYEKHLQQNVSKPL